jgi:hypothetical protein
MCWLAAWYWGTGAVTASKFPSQVFEGEGVMVGLTVSPLEFAISFCVVAEGDIADAGFELAR